MTDKNFGWAYWGVSPFWPSNCQQKQTTGNVAAGAFPSAGFAKCRLRFHNKHQNKNGDHVEEPETTNPKWN